MSKSNDIDSFVARLEAARCVEHVTAVYMELYDANHYHPFDSEAYDAAVKLYARRNKELRAAGLVTPKDIKEK